MLNCILIIFKLSEYVLQANCLSVVIDGVFKCSQMFTCPPYNNVTKTLCSCQTPPSEQLAIHCSIVTFLVSHIYSNTCTYTYMSGSSYRQVYYYTKIIVLFLYIIVTLLLFKFMIQIRFGYHNDCNWIHVLSHRDIWICIIPSYC